MRAYGNDCLGDRSVWVLGASLLLGVAESRLSRARHRALAEARVQVIPGSLMEGGAGLIRLSYATSLENIREGIARLHAWLS